MGWKPHQLQQRINWHTGLYSAQTGSSLLVTTGTVLELIRCSHLLQVTEAFSICLCLRDFSKESYVLLRMKGHCWQRPLTVIWNVGLEQTAAFAQHSSLTTSWSQAHIRSWDQYCTDTLPGNIMGTRRKTRSESFPTYSSIWFGTCTTCTPCSRSNHTYITEGPAARSHFMAHQGHQQHILSPAITWECFMEPTASKPTATADISLCTTEHLNTQPTSTVSMPLEHGCTPA